MGIWLMSLAGWERSWDSNQDFAVPAQGLYNFQVLFGPKEIKAQWNQEKMGM